MQCGIQKEMPPRPYFKDRWTNHPGAGSAIGGLQFFVPLASASHAESDLTQGHGLKRSKMGV